MKESMEIKKILTKFYGPIPSHAAGIVFLSEPSQSSFCSKSIIIIRCKKKSLLNIAVLSRSDNAKLNFYASIRPYQILIVVLCFDFCIKFWILQCCLVPHFLNLTGYFGGLKLATFFNLQQEKEKLKIQIAQLLYTSVYDSIYK
ncbi:hypothetical protein BpHYR1_038102 [Brachionus plicatilis]|uniref:Uncharacterized protein n=1 Tax=Brachionus plicatilis TaxID=10195 RepID=A0A3M7Q4K1_BRAPC|nr:hypothetical protein BpHYR1_038102 [Brachionus plicatilis]